MDSAATNHGDYFADDDFIRTDVAAGVARDRAGTRLIGLPEEFLTALHQTLEAECGPVAGPVLKAAGHDWGERFARRLTAELGEFHGNPIAAAPVARFQADLQSAFRHLGWGVLSLDFGKYDKGLLVAEFQYGPSGEAADALLAGALGGLFSHFTGQKLAAVGTLPQGDARRFLIALPERLERVAGAPDRRSFEEVVAEVEQVRM